MRAMFMTVLLGGNLLATPAASAEMSELCLASLNWTEPMCQCFAEKAQAELDEDQRQFVMASLAGDDATATSLRGSMDVQKLAQAAMFQVHAGPACAGR